MREILGEAKTVVQILKGVKYSIDYYQREYKWKEKQVRDLVNDLSNKFLEAYESGHTRRQVRSYPHYFLGSIIISKKDDGNSLVDGQQRLTSLTLMLIFLRNLQRGRTDSVNVDELIFSEEFGERSFNLRVDDRTACMEALYEGRPFDASSHGESVQNLCQRYRDIEAEFPEDLQQSALLHFIDWLLRNVHLVEIIAYTDDDAYTIFETMNDRGLSLTPTEMLKGYLLANISDGDARSSADRGWRTRIRELNEAGKDVEPDFFKAWLRSQYSNSIRQRRAGAHSEDFDRIGTEFHRWLREASASLGLTQSEDFCRFIDRDFSFYSRQYLRLVRATRELAEGLEHVLYNAHQGFTLQYMLLLAPLEPDDSEVVVRQKLRLVARFVDILLTWRLWNFRSIDYSTMQYAMFLVMRDNARRRGPELLARELHTYLRSRPENFTTNQQLRVHQRNRRALHRVLARMTEFVETQSGQPSRYIDYVAEGRNSFEVEHIWADHSERHTEEFADPNEFAEHRNRIGGLLLLEKSPNASLGDLPYEEKLPNYNSHNLLARSLHPLCYEHNPGFLAFIQRTGLPFKPYSHFKKADLEERSQLYQQLAARIWDPDSLLHEVTA